MEPVDLLGQEILDEFLQYWAMQERVEILSQSKDQTVRYMQQDENGQFLVMVE